MAKIEAQWSIYRKDREARVGDLLLVATNGRISRYGPARWAVFTTDGLRRTAIVAQGEVWNTKRYASLEREAMFEAEQAAAALS